MALGCSVALDDFGTGYSSLGYLRTLRFSTIKVDRSFVQGAAQDSRESLAIIRAVVAMAQSLDMTTTAEGVETAEEVELIRELGCNKIQGYYFGRPMEPDEAGRSLRAGRRTALRIAGGHCPAAQAAASPDLSSEGGQQPRLPRTALSNSARPSLPPSSGSIARSGCGIMPSTLPALVEHPGDVAARAVDLLGVAERHAALALEPVERRLVGEVVAVVVRHREADRLPGLVAGGEQRLAVLDRAARPCGRRTCCPALRISAPGSRPASVSTWKPLHTPSTGTPRPAAATTACMIGLRAAIAPERR